MYSIHFESDDFYALIPRKKCWQHWTINKDFRSIVVALDGHKEFLLHTQISEDASPSEDDSRGMIAKAMGCEVKSRIISSSFWRAGQGLVAEKYVNGRLMIAGDAAHIFTPTGGFGMNTGVDDAANLGWKLAAIVQGWGGPDLLASYHAERHPIGVRNATAATNLARSAASYPTPDTMEEETPEGIKARQIISGLLNDAAPREFKTLGIQLGGRYALSPVIIDDGSEPLPDSTMEYIPAAQPGSRAPHVWLADGRALFDALSDGFTLIDWSGETVGESWVAQANRSGVPVSLLTYASQPARDLYQARFCLIRPDQHVAWRGHALPDNPEEVMRHVAGCKSGMSTRHFARSAA